MTSARLKIAVGADHGGFELKQQLVAHLQRQGHTVEDCGTHSTAAVDYPVFARAVAERVSDGRAACGVLVDGAGIGSAMVANKLPGVRAAQCYDVSSARNSREHNDANVMTLGAGLIGHNLALQILDVWLSTECTADRHRRRVSMIESGRGTPEPNPQHTCGDDCCGGVCKCSTAAPAAAGALSDQDLQRIVQRVAELAGGTGPAAEECAHLACSLCRICAEVNPDIVRELLELGADRIGHGNEVGPMPRDLASYIDHTLLKPDATVKQVEDICAQAREYEFASVCINPSFVPLAARALSGSSVKVCTVVGFPLGTHRPEIKAAETRQAIREGAREIDMVINVGALKSGDDELVYRDIRAVTEACLDGRALCKVIIETALLNDEEKVRACKAARRARADFVKTSTGFGPSGATAQDVALMSSVVKDTQMGVKASGGIRSLEDAQGMIKAGATRLGVSAGIKIMKEASGLTVSEGGDAKY